MTIPDVIGISGVFLILLCYYLIQARRITVDSFWYSMINLIGSILILYSLLHTWNTASVIIEIAWIAISLYGLYKVWRRGQHT